VYKRQAYDENATNYAALLTHGADKTIRDNEGKRAVDLLANSLTKVWAMLQ
jgi:hypothetical protein